MTDIYITDSLVVPINYNEYPHVVIVQRKISVEGARRFIKIAQNNGLRIMSAVGNKAAAELLSRLLDYPVMFVTLPVFAKPGDFVINFHLRVRLPAEKTLTQEELDQLVKDEDHLWLILTEIKS